MCFVGLPERGEVGRQKADLTQSRKPDKFNLMLGDFGVLNHSTGASSWKTGVTSNTDISRIPCWKCLKLRSHSCYLLCMLGKAGKWLTRVGTWNIWRQSWVNMYVSKSLIQGHRNALVTRENDLRIPQEYRCGLKWCIFHWLWAHFHLLRPTLAKFNHNRVFLEAFLWDTKSMIFRSKPD